MTNAPYLLPQARSGFRMGNATAVDSMVNDGLWDVYNDFHMGQTAELVAEKYGISREDQDCFALLSHKKAAAAWREGRFSAEVIPVEIPAKKKGQPPTLFERDESVREDASIEALRALKPAFKKDGTVTAGNAPGVNDAAAAVVIMSATKARELGLTPMARIVSHATSGIDPKWVMMAPVDGARKAVERAGWSFDSIDLFEFNEAFAVQALAIMRELSLPPEKVNVNGGSVAIGHPIGASGARVLITLMYELARRNARRGLVALCLGGGNSVAMCIERLDWPGLAVQADAASRPIFSDDSVSPCCPIPPIASPVESKAIVAFVRLTLRKSSICCDANVHSSPDPADRRRRSRHRAPHRNFPRCRIRCHSRRAEPGDARGMRRSPGAISETRDH